MRVARCAQSRATLTVPLSRCLEPREEGMEPDDLLCSRNARSGKALVGRAQGETNQAPSLEGN